MPDDIAQEIAAAMKRPEGTITYWGTYPALLDPAAAPGTLLEVVTGALAFVVRRRDDLTLEFLYTSPGSGTFLASISLRDLDTGTPCERFFFALTWSPSGNALHVGREDRGGVVHADGKRAPFAARVGSDGTIAILGSAGTHVMAARMYHNGSNVSAPTALEVWEETKTAAGTMLQGTSSIGFLFELVTTNSVLSALVTGFEAYGGQRFKELEHEGVEANVSQLVRSFLSKEERQSGEEPAILRDAKARGIPAGEALATRINFQNYEECKRAFGRGYGVRFGELEGISSQTLEQLQRLIRYRHRVVHVSPMLGLLNGPEVPPEDPVFANRATGELAIATFDHFVHALHAATLQLRP